MQHIIMRKGVNSTMFMHIPNCSKTLKMHEVVEKDEAVEKDLQIVKSVTDYFNTQEMCYMH